MPLDTTTLDLAVERDRIETEREELAAQVATAGDGDDVAADTADAAVRGQRLDTWLAGLAWAIDEQGWDEVVIGQPTTGEMAEVDDRVRDLQQSMVGRGEDPSVEAARRNYFVAAGLVAAPPLPEDPSFEQRAQFVADETLPQFARYLEAQIDDLSAPDTAGNSFSELVAQQTTTNDST